MANRPVRPLPPYIRDMGIATQQELVMALLPYMEWVKRTDLLAEFERILPYTRVRDKKYNWVNRSIKSALYHLTQKGMIERTTGETAPCKIPGWKLQPYSYYRRTVKEMPRSREHGIKVRGEYGIKAARLKASARKEPPKKPVTALSMDDLRYIQANDLGMSGNKMAELFNIHSYMVRKIWKGFTPRHLKP